MNIDMSSQGGNLDLVIDEHGVRMVTRPFKLIKNDDHVRDLSPAQEQIITRIFEHYKDVMIEQVVLFETIHGHIAQFTKQGGRFFVRDKGRPGRFDLDDLRVLRDPGVRWVEFAVDWLKVGV